MKSHTCPHCSLLVQVDEQTTDAICPKCYNTFCTPRATDWTILVVPVLAFHFFAFCLS